MMTTHNTLRKRMSHLDLKIKYPEKLERAFIPKIGHINSFIFGHSKKIVHFRGGHDEEYLVFTHASSMSRMLEAFGIVTGTRGQFISETRMKKTGQRVISEHLCMSATELVIR